MSSVIMLSECCSFCRIEMQALCILEVWALQLLNWNQVKRRSQISSSLCALLQCEKPANFLTRVMLKADGHSLRCCELSRGTSLHHLCKGITKARRILE